MSNKVESTRVPQVERPLPHGDSEDVLPLEPSDPIEQPISRVDVVEQVETPLPQSDAGGALPLEPPDLIARPPSRVDVVKQVGSMSVGLSAKERADVDAILHTMDSNQDGFFSPEEIYKGAMEISRMRHKHSLKGQIDLIESKEKLSPDDLAALELLKRLDKDGDGEFSGVEVLEAVRELNTKNKQVTHMGRALGLAVLVILLLLGSIFGISLAVYELSKETEIDGNVMRTMDGGMVETAEQRTNFPLGSLLFLPREYRNNLDTITVELKEKGTEVDLKVQLTEFTPSPQAFDGVQRPATRQIMADMELTGLLYVSNGTAPNSEGVFNSDGFAAAFTQALEAALPRDGIDHEIVVQLQMEMEDLGNPIPNPDATKEQLKEAAKLVPKHVGAKVQSKFKSLSRSAGMQDGLQGLIDGEDFTQVLRAEVKKLGFDLKGQNYTVEEPRTTLLPQLRVITHSGDELQLMDAGHAQLLRPDGHVERFCASCTKCASLSVDDPTAATIAQEALLADLEGLDKNSGGGRRLAVCELCSSDFPQMLGSDGNHVMSRTGPSVMPCSSSVLAMGQELEASTYVMVPNMRAIRWSGHVKQFGEYEYESVTHCIEEAWLNKHSCQRNDKGEVTVSYVKEADSIYGHCHCLASDAVEEQVVAQSEHTGMYMGKCHPEQVPHLVIPVMFTVIMDSNGGGSQVTDEDVLGLVEGTNELFRGDGEDNAHDSHLRFFLKGIRRITDDAFYNQCWDTSLPKAQEYSPDPEVILHMYSCKGNEYDGPYSTTGGWAIVGSTRLSRYFMEGRGVGRLAAIFKDTLVGHHGAGVGAHELGHVFGLKHTWGQASGNCATPDAELHTDFIPDTAPHLTSTNCEDPGADTCIDQASGKLLPLLRGVDPNTNVMSYCKQKQFTPGQQRRMMEMIQRMRPSIYMRGSFKARATGCSKASASKSLGVIVTVDNLLAEVVGGIPFLDGFRADGQRYTEKKAYSQWGGCPCQAGIHPWNVDIDGMPCTGSCCVAGSFLEPWCLVSDEVCQGTNWGYCKHPEGPWTDALELKEGSTIGGVRIRKGSKIRAIKIGTGDWKVPADTAELKALLSVVTGPESMSIQFSIPSVGDCMWACVDSASCVGVIWNKETHSCHTLTQAAVAPAEPNEVCYVRERYLQVHDAPKQIKFSAGYDYPQWPLVSGTFERQPQLKNGRPVYRALQGGLVDMYDVSCLRVDPVYSWWSLVRGVTCDWVNPYMYQYGAMASDAPYPTSGKWEFMQIYSGGKPTVHDVTIEIVDSARGLYVCGNGVLEAGEDCDDGNLLPLDGCSAQCKYDVQESIVSFNPYPEVAFDYATPSLLVSFTDKGEGKCSNRTDVPLQTEVHKGVPPMECAQRCSGNVECSGFSGGDSTCILFLGDAVDGPVRTWGDARCWEKVVTACYGQSCPATDLSSMDFTR